MISLTIINFINSVRDAVTINDLFFWTGVASTVFFVLKMSVFLVTGGFSELSFDFDTVTETDTSFNFLTVETILLLLMGFGWGGLACYSVWKLPLVFSVIAGVILGLLFGCVYAYLLICIKKLDETPSVKVDDYINAAGKAYTKISARNKGQAEVTINEQLKVIEVFNGTDEDIEAFEPLKIVNVADDIVYIEKIDK